MAINKVDFAGQTLIDLTKDTATAENIDQGITAHNRSGEIIIGTKPPEKKYINAEEVSY